MTITLRGQGGAILTNYGGKNDRNRRFNDRRINSLGSYDWIHAHMDLD